METTDQLISDFLESIRAEKFKKIINLLRIHCPSLIFTKPFTNEATEILMTTSRDELFYPEKVKQKSFADATVSGLLLWNDCEQEAHTLAQNIDTPEGSYFHAIIHRREPDIWNSDYWFKRTGAHPVFPLIYDFVKKSAPENTIKKILKTSSWEPEVFNKAVEEAQNTGNTVDSDLIKIQHAELLFLIAHSYRHTIG
jgi:hypothetical protein